MSSSVRSMGPSSSHTVSRQATTKADISRRRGPARPLGEDDELHPVAQAEFGEQVAGVGLDGRRRQDEVLGDLEVRHPGDDEPQDLKLPGGQRFQPRVGPPVRLFGTGGQLTRELLEEQLGDPGATTASSAATARTAWASSANSAFLWRKPPASARGAGAGGVLVVLKLGGS